MKSAAAMGVPAGGAARQPASADVVAASFAAQPAQLVGEPNKPDREPVRIRTSGSAANVQDKALARVLNFKQTNVIRLARSRGVNQGFIGRT
jgi:hypothetical protein